MNLKTIGTASVAFLMLTGASFAQQAPTGTAPTAQGAAVFASEQEKAMYEANKDAMTGFFTDDSMATLRTDDEMKAAWVAMDEGKQAGLRSACQTAMDAKEGYGASTSAICTNVLGR